jgi:hypothetical protein
MFDTTTFQSFVFKTKVFFGSDPSAWLSVLTALLFAALCALIWWAIQDDIKRRKELEQLQSLSNWRSKYAVDMSYDELEYLKRVRWSGDTSIR